MEEPDFTAEFRHIRSYVMLGAGIMAWTSDIHVFDYAIHASKVTVHAYHKYNKHSTIQAGFVNTLLGLSCAVEWYNVLLM